MNSTGDALPDRILQFIADQERREGQRLLALADGSAGSVAELLGANRWGAYAGMELALDLLDLSGCGRLAMIGCGSFPDSLFCLHDQTTVPVLVGFDRDPGAVAGARQLVRALRLDRITIEAEDAVAIDYSEFDVVVVSVFAEPRQDVLARIAETALAGGQVLVREPFGRGLGRFEPSLETVPDRLEVMAGIEPEGGPLSLAYVTLEVTESRNERSMKPSGTTSR